MYSSYLLVLLFLFGTGIAGNRSNKHHNHNHGVVSLQASGQHHENSTIDGKLKLTPEQIHNIEIAINAIMKKYFGRPKKELTLRSTDKENMGLIHTIRVIGDAIFKQIKRLFEALGLISPTKPDSFEILQPDEPDLKSTVYHHLLLIPLRLGPYWQAAQRHLRNHFQRRNYRRRGYKIAKFEISLSHGISTDQLKISAMISAIALYGNKFYDCLQSKTPSHFDLKETLANMTNYTPEVTGRRLRNRLARPIPKCPNRNREEYNQYHAFICHGLVNNLRRSYHDCLAEVKRIDKCVGKAINETEIPKSAVKSVKSSEGFEFNVGNLEDICKKPNEGIALLVDCKLKSKPKRRNFFPDMVLYFVGGTKKLPKFKRMANRIESMITKSRIGSESLNEISTLMEIYKSGLQKKERVMKAAQRDPRQRSIFDRISEALSQYKKYIMDVTYKTVLHVNNVMTTVQKILINSASTLIGEDLAPNFRTVKCLTSWVEGIMVGWTHERRRFPTRFVAHRKIDSKQFGNGSKDSRNNLIKVPNEVGFIKNPHEEPLNELIVAMKSLGRPNKQRRSNALVSIANTFLLATMFYECISVLAGAIYCDHSDPMSSTSSAENDWESSRDRRSSPPDNFLEFVTPKPEHPKPPMHPPIMDPATAAKPEIETTERSIEDSSPMLDAVVADNDVDKDPER